MVPGQRKSEIRPLDTEATRTQKGLPVDDLTGVTGPHGR